MYNILLVDDEAVVRLGVKNCVNWKKLKIDRVFEAANGVQAVEVLRRESIDIVITDLKMAVMDGLSMLGTFEEMLYTPEIIVMSCYNDYENMRGAMRLGARDFLFKPSMYPADIEDSVERVIRRMEQSGGWRDQAQRTIGEMTAQNALETGVAFIERLEADEGISVEDARRLMMGYICRMQYLDAQGDPALAQCASELFDRCRAIRDADSARGMALLLRRCLPNASDMAGERDKNDRILDYIEAHLSDTDLSLERVAAAFGLSTSYFSRFFKSMLGYGYNDYVICRRVELAKKLKQTTDLSPEAIALRVGYQNKEYFAKLYRRQTGTSLYA